MSLSDNNIVLKMEKDLAILKLNQTDIWSDRALLKTYVEKIVQNPSTHIALILFQNNSQGREPTGNSRQPTGNSFLPFKEIKTALNKEKWEGWLDEINSLFQTLESGPVSWVAGLSGPCYGASLSLALACDYRVADLHTTFSCPELSFGLMPTGGTCLRLPKLIGLKKAMDMILNGQKITASEAKASSLIQSAVHPVDLTSSARKWAGQIHKGLIPAKPSKQYKALTSSERLWEVPFFRQIFYHKTKQKIKSQTKGFYPAPLKVLELIKKTYPVRHIKADLKEESNGFCDLMVSPVTQNLISLYENLQKLSQTGFEKGASGEVFPSCPGNWNHEFSNTGPTQKHSIKKVAVLGAGVMGGGITQWLVGNNVPVLLKDIHSPSLSATLKFLYSHFEKQNMEHRRSWAGALALVKNSVLTFLPLTRHKKKPYWHEEGIGSSPFLPLRWMASCSKEKDLFSESVPFSHVRPQMDFSGFETADLLIETVVEDKEVKKKVLRDSLKHVSPHCLLATNTSSFKISELAGGQVDPDRFFGLHFFYPAGQTPLVEVVQGSESQSEALTTLYQWLWRMGKIPIVVKDSPGFLVQRLFMPLMSEALWCLKEGLDIPTVDEVYTSFGFDSGPFALMDEIGLDICVKLIKSFQKTQGSSLGAFPAEVAYINPGFLGKKNKKGFYIYNDKRERLAVNNRMYQDLRVRSFSKNTEDILERGLYRMINSAFQVLEEKVVSTEEEVDMALILSLGFPPFRGGLLKYAHETSLKTVIAGLTHFAHKWGDRFQAGKALLQQNIS